MTAEWLEELDAACLCLQTAWAHKDDDEAFWRVLDVHVEHIQTVLGAQARLRRIAAEAEAVDAAHNPAGLEVGVPQRRGGEALSDAPMGLSAALADEPEEAT